MRLFAGSVIDFAREVKQNSIAKRLEVAFVNAYRFKPSPGEINSWQISFLEFCEALDQASLSDNGIILEMQLPRTSRRLDAMVTGCDANDHENAVVVELKQWQRCGESDADDMVSTWLNGAIRDLLHPSVQACQYRDYLADMNTAFYEGENPVGLSACAFLHNYMPKAEDPLHADKFSEVTRQVPFFGQNDLKALSDYLNFRLSGGKGVPILHRVDSAEIRPSKKLLEHVAKVIEGESRFVLLDEQKVVFERALTQARKGVTTGRKSIMLVRGGPGTGKSVLAANLLGRLCKDGLDVHYVTGSKAFTESMRAIVGRRASTQFKYFNSYTKEEPDSVDVLVCDEAHRIREKSFNQFTPKAVREALSPQIDEIINASKVSIFFIDDRQVVRPGEVGSAKLVRDKAAEFETELFEFELEAQFRCEGSDGFVNWIDNTLAIRQTANQVWSSESDNFDFRIFGSMEDLDLAIREKAKAGASARLVAGFCWKWSDPTKEGDLVDDVTVGHFQRPWNAKPDAKKLRKGIPKSVHWAIKPEGLDQVGCVYTAQGFEFDYVGVIWGLDLRFSPDKQQWIGDQKESYDSVVKRSGKQFVDLVKNTYRVLLSRGLKGCYVYCQDPETAKFLLSRTEGLQLERRDKATAVRLAGPKKLPFESVTPFKDSLPLYDFSIAAGGFGDFQIPNVDEVEWVEIPSGVKATADMFVAKVDGESMNAIIPNGSYCIFRSNPVGSRDGRIVVAQLRDFSDPEGGGCYTVKRYRSTKQTAGGKRRTDDDRNVGKVVTLNPESTVSSFKPITVPADDEQIRIIAEFVRVL